MSVQAGTRLGHYEITAPIGAGGMGEVYRAKDGQLGRDVALKVLPQSFASDPDRLARFRREAHLLASLNHPHIATVHGLEDSDTAYALVMELVEGPTLAERIGQGAIPLEEALPIAGQIAEALEYAHERGIVHRDLKPANVKLTADGAVKVLDFGLAKALGLGDEPQSPQASNSPTLSAVATRAGILLGTAAYMSPEQAKGKPVDRRSDIWSFGVVLYEMLSGRRLYSAESAAETLALVLTKEPDFGALAGGTPRRVRELLRRCLTKDARKRLQWIGEARIALDDASSGARDEAAAAVPPAGLSWPRALALAAAAALIGGGLMSWAPRQPVPELPVPQRMSVELGADAELSGGETGTATGDGPAAVLSPDGKLLAFTARKAAGQLQHLYLRRLDQLTASPLSGTEGAHNIFFSPDSQWVGFFADGKLKKVAVAGGAAVALCDAPGSRGGTWSEDGTIFFIPRPVAGLARVSSAGGIPESLTPPDPATGPAHRWPQVLPGGKALLVTAGEGGNFANANIIVESLPNGPRKVLHRGGYHGRYLRSGHLVFMHHGSLFAAPFDVGRLELRGPPAPVLEGVIGNEQSGGAQFSFSDGGALVFRPGPSVGIGAPIQWMDKEGRTEPLRAIASDYYHIRFSPDGQRLAMGIREGAEQDVWVYEWGRDTMSRLTFAPGDDLRPVWTPDGRRIAFASARADKATRNLYWQRSDGSGEAQRLTESRNAQMPASWHPSGKYLAYIEDSPQTGQDIMILPVDGDEASGFRAGKPSVFVNGPFLETDAAFSPDGRWLAYRSDESGRSEIYVRPFPGPGGRWQVSAGGGAHPTWFGKRKELLYRSALPTLFVAPYSVEGESFRAEKPRQWSPGRVPQKVGLTIRTFDLHPDGQRVAVLKDPEQPAEEKRDHVVLIQNFFEEVRRAAPAGRR
jgi:serine/threonine-protein kinase